jgi:hypothetical protein
LRKNRFSRRKFGKCAVTAALTAIAHPSTGAPSEEFDNSDLTLAQLQEVDAWFNEAVRRYGDRLSDEQRNRMRRILAQNQRLLAPIRDFPMNNGDAPATTLKLLEDTSRRGTYARTPVNE